MNGPPDPGTNPFENIIGDHREQIHRTLHLNLKKVPGVSEVRFETSGTGVECQIIGVINTLVFANGVIPTQEARISVNWWPLDGPDRHYYKFHYHDTTGFDCGWHRSKNPHVGGLDHYQEREDNSDDYTYHETELNHSSPVAVLWEIMSERLPSRLEMKYS